MLPRDGRGSQDAFLQSATLVVLHFMTLNKDAAGQQSLEAQCYGRKKGSSSQVDKL